MRRVLPCGDAALLVECDAPAELYAALRDDPPAGVVELVPGADTVLARFDPADADEAALRHDLATRPAGARVADRVQLTEIPVMYDGADLAEVAKSCGLTVADVIARHAGASYQVAFCGFAPGFAYLTGLDPALHVPRLDRPRTRVPAGSVAIAGPYAAVYPRASPGGWRLLGHTDVQLWDLARTPPALLVPGTRVRFVPQ